MLLSVQLRLSFDTKDYIKDEIVLLYGSDGEDN